MKVWFSWIASPQQGDLRLSGLPSGRNGGNRARTRDRRVPENLREDSLATEENNEKGFPAQAVEKKKQLTTLSSDKSQREQELKVPAKYSACL
ncbi:hypothetical protein PoB_004005500 [Plakobranchus ocellatus]|uniref:Uncharacterized protein n=1 Tax=Plakobranchus ocellatus TaxID=259542 RepID=A0AAV4B1T2_9GAST|nr:hypothetical protein PoB_004005500 [Plakobranchus ocellatus]